MKCDNFLKCSDRQFGFRKNASCAQAIYAMKRVVNNFTEKGSTVNICSLDLSKAFDKINHKILFRKLMERNVPKFFITLLVDWYSKLKSKVKWGDSESYSEWFEITMGIRQGGVLSPLFYSVYVDEIFQNLEKTGKGCFIGHMTFNILMYADDLVILSISLADLQHMIDICYTVFKRIRLDININKSACVRIGKRHKVKLSDMIVNGVILQWKEQFEYLGIVICSAMSFTVNLQRSRQKFFAPLNSIFSKVGSNTSSAMLISLIEAQCVSSLLYASECLEWSKSMLNSLDNTICQAYFKIFKTFDKTVAFQCMYYMGQLPADLKIAKRRIQFLSRLETIQTYSFIMLLNGDKELSNLLNKYNLTSSSWGKEQFLDIFKNSLGVD